MCHRNNELNVAWALATYLLLGNLYTATVAGDTFITDALILTAGALEILCRTEDALAEQTVALGLVCAIVNGLGLGYFAVGVLEDLLGRR